MVGRKNKYGGGVPPGWSVRNALGNRGRRLARTRGNELFSPRLLVGPSNHMQPSDWPVRDQGTRGTCSAFALAAAEELVETNERRKMTDLSEEFLYAHMREDIFGHLEEIGVDVAMIDQEEILRSGGTFLWGGVRALEVHGICEERFAKYDKSKSPENYTMSEFSDDAVTNSKARRRHQSEFEHDITKEPTAGDDRFWVNKSNDVAVSSVLAKKIQQGLPVAASFAVLSGIGTQAWESDLARHWGKVKYPPDSYAAANLKPIGGHTVCLIGVVVDDSPNDNPGWFLFRNSIGSDGFAKSAPKNGLSSFQPAPGYGRISAHDVDRYCWEYLSRSNTDSAPATG